jgi:MscS family membrane protein
MKNSIKLLRSYIYVLLWTLYFSFYFLFPNHEVFLYAQNVMIYWDFVLSYFNAIFWLITVLWISNLIIRLFQGIFQRITKKTETELDDIVWNFIIKFLDLIKYIGAAYTFFYLAITPKYIDVIVDKATSVLIIFIFLSLTTSFVNIIFEKELIFKSKLKAVSRTLLPFINKIIVIFIWVIWAITIIGNLGYDVSALIAWAWIWGLAVALAAQKSLTNVFGAITILLNKPFKIWDYISINGNIGTVKEIWLSYLTITDKMGHQVMIPNETIISTSIENFSVRSNRRTDFWIGVVYGTTQEKMQEWVKIIEDILEKYVEDETMSSYRVNFDMFWDFSLNISITYFSLVNKCYKDYIKQKEEINLSIKVQFEKAWLNMAFPTQELIIKKEV